VRGIHEKSARTPWKKCNLSTKPGWSVHENSAMFWGELREESSDKVDCFYGGFGDDRIQHVTIGSGCPFWGGHSRQNRRNYMSIHAMTESSRELLRTLQFGRTSRTYSSWILSTLLATIAVGTDYIRYRNRGVQISD
jgi:hypothetical protein